MDHILADYCQWQDRETAKIERMPRIIVPAGLLEFIADQVARAAHRYYQVNPSACFEGADWEEIFRSALMGAMDENPQAAAAIFDSCKTDK